MVLQIQSCLICGPSLISSRQLAVRCPVGKCAGEPILLPTTGTSHRLLSPGMTAYANRSLRGGREQKFAPVVILRYIYYIDARIQVPIWTKTSSETTQSCRLTESACHLHSERKRHAMLSCPKRQSPKVSGPHPRSVHTYIVALRLNPIPDTMFEVLSPGDRPFR